MKFLNGWKTITGAIGLVVGLVSQREVVVLLPVAWQPYVIGGAAVLTALGVAHKVEKAKHGTETDH